MELRIVIIADDLTSAADAAAAHVSCGRNAVIHLSPLADEPVGVISVDVNSRTAEPGVAASRVAAAVRNTPGDVVFKTIDSTLRGNVGAEIQAAIAAAGRPLTVIAPAFPAEGRTTVNGVQLVDGVPVSQTHFAQDRQNPVRTSEVAVLVPGARHSRSGASLATATGVFIIDATTDHDLDLAVVRAGDPRRVLWIGSPGLSAALARAIPHVAAPAETGFLPQAESVLVVVGSENPVSRAQLQHVKEATHVDLRDIGPGDGSADLAGRLAAAPTVTITDSSTDISAYEARRRIRTVGDTLRRIGVPDALVLTGGDTARTMLDELGIRSLRLVGELAPGVVVGQDAAERGPTVVLKAGGFGSPGLLLEIVNALRSGGIPMGASGRRECTE